MKRPILKDYDKKLKSIDDHTMDLIKWSWWAEIRIEELEMDLRKSKESQSINTNTYKE